MLATAGFLWLHGRGAAGTTFQSSVADSINITSAHDASSSTASIWMATQEHGPEMAEFPDARQAELLTEIWMEQELAELECVLERTAGALSGLMLRSSARVLQEEEEERAGANSGTVDPRCDEDIDTCSDEGEDIVGGADVGAEQNATVSQHEHGPAALTLPLNSPVTVRRERGRNRGCHYKVWRISDGRWKCVGQGRLL